MQRRSVLGEPGRTVGTPLAQGLGWSVTDVVCTLGPQDQPFEERHAGVSVGIVLAGTFHYRSARGRELLTPGSLLLGNDRQSFECGHEHAAGDRCVAFHFSPEYFEQITAELGVRRLAFPVSRIPPLAELAPINATVAAAALGAAAVAWDEIGVVLAARAIRLANALSDRDLRVLPAAEARVAQSVRAIEKDSSARLSLARLAADAGLSPFHFLRTFQRITGATPHQFILRTRLREAATRLVTESTKVAEIAFAAGFGDLSNFNHAFRAEFGVSPRRFRDRTDAPRTRALT